MLRRALLTAIASVVVAAMPLTAMAAPAVASVSNPSYVTTEQAVRVTATQVNVKFLKAMTVNSAADVDGKFTITQRGRSFDVVMDPDPHKVQPDFGFCHAAAMAAVYTFGAAILGGLAATGEGAVILGVALSSGELGALAAAVGGAGGLSALVAVYIC